MSEDRPSVEKLEKQIRVLRRKLERSEWHRVDLENQHDRDQHLYRRLQADLEAARREAEVEAALERVRSRTMAMRSSDELAETAAVLFQELKALNLLPSGTRTYISIVDRETETAEAWMTRPDGSVRPSSHQVPLTEHPSLVTYYDNWKRQERVSVRDHVGPDLVSYLDYVLTLPHTHNDEGYQRLAASPPARIVMTDASFSEGTVGVMSAELLTPEAREVLQRFTVEFDRTYTRFLDLQKAEAQAREAEIEAALERVRSRVTAMRSSDELHELSFELVKQVRALGVDTWHCAFNIYDDGEESSTEWGANADGFYPIYKTPRVGIFRRYYEIGQTGTDLHVEVIGPDRAADHYAYLCTLPGVGEQLLGLKEAGISFPESQIDHVAYFKYGYLIFITYEPTPESHDVFRRFARVFEQAYTRFLDLQRAEERALQARRQASLDRVRAEIASMRTAADLQRITPLVWRELTILGVPFFRCGVFIIDEAAEAVQVFLTTPEGKALAALPLGFDDATIVSATVAHWRQGLVYTEQWDADAMQDWTSMLEERGLITESRSYLDAEAPPERLALHFVPFAQGMLYVGSTAPLAEEAIELVRALADAFAIAYARYEDFRRLEAKNREVEAAMDELKATQQQLVQSEKLASLGQLTAGIAHEIKNPLNFVNNFAEVNAELADELQELLGDGLAEAVQDVLNDLKQNASFIAQHGKRADSIVHAMMQHASGGKGEREATDLNALVSEYVDLAYHGKRAQVPGFQVTLERDLSDDVGKVNLVPQEVGRVVLNLLSNAFDAVHEHVLSVNGAYIPTVSVSTRQREAQVEIRVSDNGPGIPEQIRSKIFEPFFTTKPTGTGTGLGLSLSYDIVTQGHGGMLGVESNEGEGTTFIVTLPATHKAPDSDA